MDDADRILLRIKVRTSEDHTPTLAPLDAGLIGFVGIIVPHTIRLLFGSSYRVILPLTVLFGGAFIVAADIVARLVLEPAEMPIG